MARRNELLHIQRRQESSGAMGDARGISKQLLSLLPQEGARVEHVLALSAYSIYREKVFPVVKTRLGEVWRGREYIVLRMPESPSTASLQEGDVLTELPPGTRNSGILHTPPDPTWRTDRTKRPPIDNTDYHRLLALARKFKEEDTKNKEEH